MVRDFWLQRMNAASTVFIATREMVHSALCPTYLSRGFNVTQNFGKGVLVSGLFNTDVNPVIRSKLLSLISQDILYVL